MPSDSPHAIPGPSNPVAEEKARLRREFRARRAAQSADERADADARRAVVLRRWIAARNPGYIAAYVARSPEPDLGAVLDAFHAEGVRILLPMLGRRADGSVRRAPDWAFYAGPGTLRPGLWGIGEPATEALGIQALGLADVLLLPGLAADRAGTRLGMGGGWYDRALAYARPDAPRVIALGDDEIVTALPREPHDLGVDAAATPSGVTALGSARTL